MPSRWVICAVVVVVIILIVAVLVGVLIWYFTSQGNTSDMSDTSDTSGTAETYYNQTVATDTPKCSKIGEDILNKGGSAVDAAIAAMFCLGVINMHSSGVGGGGVMLVYNRAAKNASFIDFRETAPFTVSNFTPNATGVKESRFGGLAIAVPGEVKGMYQASQNYGRLPWRELVKPAIELARDGFEISAAVAEALVITPEIKEHIEKDPGLRELLLDKNGKPYTKGQRITNEKYAETLEIIQQDPESFYSGSLAKNISRDMRNINSKVSRRDLRNYRAVIREPKKGNLSNMAMYLSPPPSSGAVLALILNILKGYEMTPADLGSDDASVLTYHRIIEAFKFAYAWRSRLGDPAFNSKVQEFAKKMLNQRLGELLRQKIQDDRTHYDVSYYAKYFSHADYGTTHISVLAENGNAVAVTSSINMRFGCGYRSMDTGIIYNNDMADFDIPGYKVVDNIHPSPFNFPEPGKRPFSSMTPTILTDHNGDVQVVIGASGGKMITTAVSLVLMNKLWFGMTLSDAVDKPRLHNQLVPNQDVTIERKEDYRLKEEIVQGLEKIGHEVKDSTRFAAVQAAYRKGKGEIEAKSDPRKFGAPAGQ
ncbi:PREDICTED: gamma-glutamyltranspeptidase 1-like isoform X3 [Acropora digitifera]|uniref:gamma-glutamyltranspeptidase 1-like isoform X3 n=1 Tax=Acropora digitifera TaxID=70779 RepID=UPI00077A7789|nr:PREDICTED: gamma-glutamyltranspeptidase 1-like isoform X3 [Acropora digitifera]